MNSTVLRWFVPLAFLAIMLGGVGAAQATGQWITSGRQQVTAGPLTPDDLRGWMSLQAAADGLGVPVEEMIGLVGAPEGVTLTGATAFKELEELVPGFELTEFRAVLRTRLGITAAPVAPDAAPSEGTPRRKQP